MTVSLQGPNPTNSRATKKYVTYFTVWPWILVGSGMHGVVLDVIIIMALGNVVSAGMLDNKGLAVPPV